MIYVWIKYVVIMNQQLHLRKCTDWTMKNMANGMVVGYLVPIQGKQHIIQNKNYSTKLV